MIIKLLQEQVLAKLPVNILYIILSIRSDPPRADDFHWGYYIHLDPKGGNKHHATGEKYWVAEHLRTHGVFKSSFLCALIHIADVPPQDHAKLDAAMRSFDHCMNDHIKNLLGPTCQVWVIEVAKNLIEAGLVNCSGSAKDLQEECLKIGNKFMDDTVMNEQPRPIVNSELCQ